MKIEFLTSYFSPYVGGIETVVKHLAEGLGKAGHDVCVHTANATPSYKNLPQYEEKEYYIIKRYNIFPFSLFLPKLTYNNSVISMHNYSCLMNDYASLIYKKRKKILTPYGNLTYNLNQRQHQLLAPIYDNFIGMRTLMSMDQIVAMTPYEKMGIANKYPFLKNKISIIPGGIDIFKNKIIDGKRRFSFKYFLSIGRVIHTKKFDDVLKILKFFPEYHYVLAGRDIEYVNFLNEVAKDLGVVNRFHYLGEVTDDEKIELMSQADMFIMSSSAEAFSIASLEAFYYSNKVIGAKSGGIVDLFKELGGEVYNFGDINDLRKAIRIELEKRSTERVKNDRIKIIERKYSWDVVIKNYEKVFEE